MSLARFRPGAVLLAWAILLAVSLLPTVIVQEVFHGTVSLDQRTAWGLGVLGLAVLASLVYRPLRDIRLFLVVLATLLAAQWAVFTKLATLPAIDEWTHSASFDRYMPAELLLNLIVTAAVLAVVLALKRDRRACYLALGDLAAPTEPVGWLNIRRGERWTQVGRNLAVAITLGTLAFLVLSGQPSASMLGRMAPMLPVILLAAAVNAFNEEATYKASMLAVLVGPVGERQALRLVAAYFGIAHFYGVPYGLIGVALAWFLGWILARSMLETRGMGWAWFIHFLQDVAIFSFMAAGSITPGGA
jgi:hypothetical protein